MRSLAVTLLATLALAPGAGAYEDFARREVLSCDACHASSTDFTLTDRGEVYKENSYSFPGEDEPEEPEEEEGPDEEALAAVAARDPRTVKPVLRLMEDGRDALRVTTDALSEGDYPAAVEGARALQDVAGKMEGLYRAERRAVADQARAMRQAAFRLERTLRRGGRRRVAVAPIQLGQVVGACLACHAAEGHSREGFRLSGAPSPGARPGKERSLPTRARNSRGTRR